MLRVAGRTIARAERLKALLGEEADLATLSSRWFFAETRRRGLSRSLRLARLRAWLVRGVQVTALGLAICLGAVVGSGVLTAEGRHYRQQISALEASTRTFTVPEVAGHPGAVGALERRHLIRQFVALDGAN
ncbi:MAG: hypothetical protein GWN99_16320 [Gemmatimonadetes bacterium]|uniref:Uncharacterized protein n=1 Tax=Candidatus Kutchimonas denitrificans TaxID=3056748 RepID=A0AAE5CCL6_9BACT|nr:hypothetical protein [Gemmatimonadota bacterium]NIR74354.1 hypothetical protein [Candidatus Kutchimonas denitrificans]NIS02605.1 hypothetical protein [Gemmatimonadota bacterium]NIT68480.1 hypothetical protein [Gemmatimonadota bacterium]NIU51957.1 hypothetical protein [Gemmatimonadota bacterium]